MSEYSITDDLPEGISRSDFRDPFPVKTDDGYYVFVGGKLVKENKGIIVVLGGSGLEKLEYKFTIGPFYELGDMGECPCYRRIDGKDVIIASGCNVPARGNDFKNVNSSVFIVGTIDFAGKTFVAESIREIDKGDAFYAPQLINGDDRPVMVGWHEMWGKPYPTEHMNHGWAGCFTVPRVLSGKGRRRLPRRPSTSSTAISSLMRAKGCRSAPTCALNSKATAKSGFAGGTEASPWVAAAAGCISTPAIPTI